MWSWGILCTLELKYKEVWWVTLNLSCDSSTLIPKLHEDSQILPKDLQNRCNTTIHRVLVVKPVSIKVKDHRTYHSERRTTLEKFFILVFQLRRQMRQDRLPTDERRPLFLWLGKVIVLVTKNFSDVVVPCTTSHYSTVYPNPVSPWTTYNGGLYPHDRRKSPSGTLKETPRVVKSRSLDKSGP